MIEKQKLLTGEQVKPKLRFLLGLRLASTFHRNGREAFIQNAEFCGFSAAEIDAMLPILREDDNLKLRPGYTPEAETPN
jgi:hypothetical protein